MKYIKWNGEILCSFDERIYTIWDNYPHFFRLPVKINGDTYILQSKPEVIFIVDNKIMGSSSPNYYHLNILSWNPRSKILWESDEHTIARIENIIFT